MVRLILAIILITNIAYADDAVWLDKGQTAPYQGYLLPEDKLIELRNNTLERDALKGQNSSLNTSLTLQNDIIARKDNQLKLYSDQNDKLATTALNAESMSNYEKLGFIGLGILMTGLAIAGVHALYK